MCLGVCVRVCACGRLLPRLRVHALQVLGLSGRVGDSTDPEHAARGVSRAVLRRGRLRLRRAHRSAGARANVVTRACCPRSLHRSWTKDREDQEEAPLV